MIAAIITALILACAVLAVAGWRSKPGRHRADPFRPAPPEVHHEEYAIPMIVPGWAEEGRDPPSQPAASIMGPRAALQGEPSNPAGDLDAGAELFPCIYCETDTPNGAPCPVCGWERCAVCRRCTDQAAHDTEAGGGLPPACTEAFAAIAAISAELAKPRAEADDTGVLAAIKDGA